MGEIADALERADREGITREPPKSVRARINFLARTLKTTRAVASALGVSQRSVERYRTGERKHPPKHIADRIDAAVRARWQPQVRARRRRRAATSTGITIETRASFGFIAAGGSTDDARMRLLTQHLPPEYARRLFEAQDQGLPEQDLRDIVAEGLQEVYFKEDGTRAEGLLVAFTNIDYVDVSY